MIRKYHNKKKLQTTLWHHEEEPLNHHETPGRQIKQSNQLSLPHQDDCNTRMTAYVNTVQLLVIQIISEYDESLLTFLKSVSKLFIFFSSYSYAILIVMQLTYDLD